MILLLDVDDMLIIGQDVHNVHKLKVDMKDLGHAKHILGNLSCKNLACCLQ